jgi:hypothetical protein
MHTNPHKVLSLTPDLDYPYSINNFRVNHSIGGGNIWKVEKN